MDSLRLGQSNQNLSCKCLKVTELKPKGVWVCVCVCVRAFSRSVWPILCDPMDCSPADSSVQGDSPGKNTGVGYHALLQRIFPTQGSNPGLPHCRWILYQLSYKGNPRILEWVAYPLSSGSSQPRNGTRVSCIAGGFFTNWAIREAHKYKVTIFWSPFWPWNF